MATYIWIGIGGFLGANARYLVQTWAANRWGAHFPFGTMIANITGAFLLALFATITIDRMQVRPEIRLFFATGFLGGYTTFSSFGHETWQLLTGSGWWMAALNLLGNIMLGGIGILLGVLAARLVVSTM